MMTSQVKKLENQTRSQGFSLCFSVWAPKPEALETREALEMRLIGKLKELLDGKIATSFLVVFRSTTIQKGLVIQKFRFWDRKCEMARMEGGQEDNESKNKNFSKGKERRKKL